MKIEDSPHHFGSSSPIEKLRHTQFSVDHMLNDLDLSFLDLLSATAAAEGADTQATANQALNEKNKNDPTNKTHTSSEVSTRPRLTVVGGKTAVASSPQEDLAAQVEKDMALLQSDLTELDTQYLKQIVIPGLPIAMGSVPFNSVFPTSESGQISYRGFEVSPKLAELIEKGYKTGRPIRVELDPHSAVVIKIRNGQVSAQFLSTDKTLAMVMQQDLDDLRNRMIQKNLPVGTLEYQYRDPSRSHQNQEENEDETP